MTKLNITGNINRRAMYSEKDRLFTDFKLAQNFQKNIKKQEFKKTEKTLILCDRSGRIYELDPKTLIIIKEPLKGYRDVQMSMEPMWPEDYDPEDEQKKKFLVYSPMILALLPKRNLLQAINMNESN